VDTLFIFCNGRPPLPSLPLHLQSMVGRNGLFSGYKSQRTKGHRERKKKTEPGSETERNRTRENFGPSTSSTSCFYHHCLRLRRRRSDRELEKGTNRRRGSNTGNTTRRAKTERKRSRHRGEKTNTKGRK
jgi:hypothetical protein